MQINKSDITTLETNLIEWIKTSDTAKLDKVLHDDLLFITPDGQTVTKAMDLDAHRSGGMVVERLDITMEQVNIIGDTAVSVVSYDSKGSMMGTPIEGRFRYIRIWKQFEDGIKVIGGSCTAV